jgi:hypothetical protein
MHVNPESRQERKLGSWKKKQKKELLWAQKRLILNPPEE